MKKILLTATAFLMLFSCQNDQTESTVSATNAIARRSCASQDVLAEQLKADPILALRMNQIEAFTQKSMLTNRLVNGKVVIPVVVNVLYRTAAENISDAQIQSQIDVLNEDFSRTNADTINTPAIWQPIGGAMPKADLKLKDISGKEIAIRDVKKEHGLLVMFSCNTCPFVIKNQQRTVIVGEYAKKMDVGFIVLNSNEAQRKFIFGSCKGRCPYCSTQ